MSLQSQTAVLEQRSFRRPQFNLLLWTMLALVAIVYVQNEKVKEGSRNIASLVIDRLLPLPVDSCRCFRVRGGRDRLVRRVPGRVARRR